MRVIRSSEGDGHTIRDVDLRAHESVQVFLREAGPLLLRDEARHNLIYGICATLVESPDAYPDVHLWTIEDGAETRGAALMTPPFNLVVAQPVDDATLEFTAEALRRQGVTLPGVTGAVPEVERFVMAWGRVAGARARVRMAQGIYAVRAPTIPDAVPGRMRFAGAGDRELLVDWTLAFEAEAVPEDAPRIRAEEIVDRRLESTSGGMALWEDGGKVVSLSGFGGGTPHGIRIGPVYTPPALRRRGYASALVAQLSAQLLDGGLDYCFLYTDLANPTSNRIYTAVGYELVCESADYVFESRPR
jgi:uncharacterized protein